MEYEELYFVCFACDRYVHERESFPNAKSLEGTLASEEVGKNVVEGDAEHLRKLEK